MFDFLIFSMGKKHICFERMTSSAIGSTYPSLIFCSSLVQCFAYLLLSRRFNYIFGEKRVKFECQKTGPRHKVPRILAKQLKFISFVPCIFYAPMLTFNIFFICVFSFIIRRMCKPCMCTFRLLSWEVFGE